MEELFLQLEDVSAMSEAEACDVYAIAEEAGVVAEPIDLGELIL